MAAIPPASVPVIAPAVTSPVPSPAAGPSLAPDSSGQNTAQNVGSNNALLSLSPVTTVEVLLICISGAVILHFITRYLYLRAHRQLLSGHQQQVASSSTGNAGARLSGASGAPGGSPRNDIEMNHSMKPTVLVVQPNEEVCCGVEEDFNGPASQQANSESGDQRKPGSQR